jgi:hypothetical protein
MSEEPQFDEKKLTGWPLVAVWLALILGSWGFVALAWWSAGLLWGVVCGR